MNPGFWRNRRVLVTGHTGFKGSWLCWWLRHLGAEVTGFALAPPTQPSLFEASGLASAMRSRQGDVRDPGALRAAFDDSRPEVAFHLAAQSLVRESYRSPGATFDTNVAGTVNCLEAARAAPGLRALVVVTSDKCYRPPLPGRGYREDDPLGGDDPYSASKAGAEIAVHSWRKSFFSGAADALVATVRAGNVIGGGDWATDRLVPDAVRAFEQSRAVRLRHPGATRPWQHVLEPLCGYLMLAERLHDGDRPAARAWNFGPAPGDARPVSWLVEQLVRRWGEGARWEKDGGEQPAEAAELALDSSLAQSRLGWRPALPLEEALDWVTDWYRRRAAQGARALTLEQVARYQERVAA